MAVTHADLLAKLARVSAVEVASSALAGNAVRSIADSSRGISQMDVEVVYERLIDVPAEREKLTKDLAKFEKGLQAAERQLGNEAFMGKAPAHIVEGLRKQASETQMLYDKAKAALEALPEA